MAFITWVSPFKTDRVAMMGLENTGKTVILHRLMLNKVICTVPTIGMNVETVRLADKSHPMEITDLGGEQEILDFSWPRFLDEGKFHGFVFVLDGTQPGRYLEGTSFRRLVDNNRSRGCPILVLVNKLDLPQERSLNGVIDSLQLNALGSRMWHIQACSAYTGQGIKESFEELSRMVKCYRKANRL